MLDGLEVTIVGAMGGVLQSKHTLGLSAAEIGAVASCYLAGAVAGALVFGWLTDRFGRRKIFFITLACYLTGVALSAFSWDFFSFAAFRMLTGFGIGGEYAAVNSAIDELMPARLRGRLDLAINGTYWLGAALGAAATIFLLDPKLLPVDLGWRLGFGIGAVLGLGVILLRNFVPESPRWLITHGQPEAAEAAMAEIERHTQALPAQAHKKLTLHPEKNFGLWPVFQVMLGRYRARSFLVFVLMAAQAFLYNALFFTYALVLVRFYQVPADNAGLFLLPLAAGNFLGPLLLGRFFDTIGRRRMIAGTYALSGALLAGTGYLFAIGVFTAATQTLAWAVIFFFASAAASAAYLTASEIFPLEMRAMAIAIFYALGTAAGGVLAPWFFGSLIGTGSRWSIFGGYVFAAALMFAAAGIAAWLGIDAENRSLEDISAPLSQTEEADA
ncbi:MAG: MFS transporter [Rhodospirillales bacterium 20-64-7]|nr:MAG: MFS transporter [Rhodospirillales bacterium 20-64-7]